MSTNSKLLILVIVVAIIAIAIWGGTAIVNIMKNTQTRENLNIVTEEAQVFYDENIAEHIPGSKTLIAFFSWGGHTEQLADAIALKTGAKSIILDSDYEYPTEYEECLSIAQAQKVASARPKIRDLGVNLLDYSTIFIGYPIWLEDMPMPVYSFIEGNDFAGKTVIPFTTSGSSGESGTFEKIKNMLSSANVLTGIHFSEDAINSNSFIDELNNWLDELGIKF